MNKFAIVVMLATCALAMSVCCASAAEPRSEGAIKCVGHRGDYPDAPEGSRAAYANSVARGSDILKLDLHLTKDGVPVLSHDPTLKRTMGWDVKIRNVTLAEILEHEFKPVGAYKHEKIVPLKDGLEYAKKIPELWLDFKYFEPEFCEQVLRLVREAGIDERRVMCATFTQEALIYLKERHPGIRRVGHISILRDKKQGTYGTSFGAAPCKDLENDMVAEILAYRDRLGLWGVNIIAHNAMTPAFVQRLKEKGLWFSLALVHTAEQAQRYAPLKPDCVVTGDVRVVRPIFDLVRGTAMTR